MGLILVCKYLFTLVLSCCFLTAGCASNDESVLIPNEQTIKIGVVGHPPMVDEKNIEFTELELGAVSSTSDTEFHALFIMPESLEEASSARFAGFYKNVKYPVFFIGSTKSFYPFIEETLTYSKAPSTNSGMYATGFINENGQYKIIEYGFKNDEQTEENLKDLYSRIFNTILTEFAPKEYRSRALNSSKYE